MKVIVCCHTDVPTCSAVGGTRFIRESVLEGADLAVRGAGVAVGARGDDGVAAAVQDTELPEYNGQTYGEDHLYSVFIASIMTTSKKGYYTYHILTLLNHTYTSVARMRDFFLSTKKNFFPQNLWI